MPSVLALSIGGGRDDGSDAATAEQQSIFHQPCSERDQVVKASCISMNE